MNLIPPRASRRISAQTCRRAHSSPDTIASPRLHAHSHQREGDAGEGEGVVDDDDDDNDGSREEAGFVFILVVVVLVVLGIPVHSSLRRWASSSSFVRGLQVVAAVDEARSSPR